MKRGVGTNKIRGMRNAKFSTNVRVFLYYARKKFLYCSLYLDISLAIYNTKHFIYHKIIFIEICGNVQFHFTVIGAGEIL